MKTMMMIGRRPLCKAGTFMTMRIYLVVEDKAGERGKLGSTVVSYSVSRIEGVFMSRVQTTST